MIQTLLDHCPNFFLSFDLLMISRSGFSACPGGSLLQFPVIFQPYIFQFSTNWQCYCSQHVYIFPSALGCSSFQNVFLHPFLSIGIHPFYRLCSGSQVVLSFLIRAGLTDCNYFMFLLRFTYLSSSFLLFYVLHSQRKNGRMPTCCVTVFYIIILNPIFFHLLAMASLFLSGSITLIHQWLFP